MLKSLLLKFAAAAALAAFAAAPAAAQDVESTDQGAAAGTWDNAPAEDAQPDDTAAPAENEWFPADEQAADAAPGESPAEAPAAAAGAQEQRIPRSDVFSAAENLFGRGAAGLGGLLERILRDQGEPIAYISGSEASGAFVFGVRYGSGVMRHRIEGDRDVYWTGPSIGFDVGADANKVFVLVYNLNDSQRLFRRYPGGEGNAYFVGGFAASYLRRGDVVLIPVRLGVGMRLGVNAGYMRFSQRNRWLPF
jgi:hypothetical protein